MEAEEQEDVIVLKESETCIIKVNLPLSVLTVYCKRHMESKQIQQTLLDMLEIVETYDIRYLMGDVRALYYLKVEDANWIWDNILPIVKTSSVIKWARVENPSSMVELNSLQIKQKLQEEGTLKSELQFETFVDEESALHWLLYG